MKAAEQLNLDQILVDDDVWPRERLDPGRVHEFRALYLAEGLRALPPLDVVRDELGRLILADGRHRLTALSETTAAAAPAVIHHVPPGEEASGYAYRLAIARSALSAKPLTRREKRAAVGQLLELQPEQSDRAIGRLVGVDHKTVGQIRREGLEPAGHETRTPPTPASAATRLFRGFEKAYEARGLGIADYFQGDRTGQRLAAILSDSYDERALERATQFRGWLDKAITVLDDGGS